MERNSYTLPPKTNFSRPFLKTDHLARPKSSYAYPKKIQVFLIAGKKKQFPK